MKLSLVQEAQAASAVLICDGAGQIKRVLRDTIGLEEILIEGRLLQDIIGVGSAAKARAFIEALRLGEPIEEWQLEMPIFARRVSLSFVGCAVRFNHLLLVASHSRSGLIRTCEELLECDGSSECPESALNQFLAALRSEPLPRPQPFDNNAKLYGELDTMQRELSVRSAELSRAADQRNRLYAAVAHDLRSPLAAVNGYASLMLEDGDGAMRPEACESLSRIKASSEFAIDLIDSLLDPSAIESGRLELKKRAVCLSEVVSGTLATNELFARQRNVHLSATLPGDLHPARVDPGRIAQVLNHLVANAIKFSPSGASVSVSLEQSGANATLRIVDQGPGMTRARLSRILTSPQIQRVGAQPPKPIGIGLAICRKVVAAHGGRFEVDSEPGVGSTFTIVLPLSQHHPRLEHPTTPAAH
ncbi:MAG TPA: HAMP domain-containing sensor histidine kinase [Candidatus Binataceae bacterium]|nr:HAMP domain-containing sensor histidine kinase [Candidatus Binataceae bacterium]